MQRFYTLHNLADLMSLQDERISSLVESGRLKAYRIDGEIRIGEEDVTQYLTGCVVQVAQRPTVNGTGTRAVEIPSTAEPAVHRQDCRTFGGQATFAYSGSVLTGTIIWPGQRTSYKLRFDAKQWAALLEAFMGKEVRAGLNFSSPEPGSFGEWIKIHWNTKMGPAAYVGGILINEGYAERPRPGWIKIFAEPTPPARADVRGGS